MLTSCSRTHYDGLSVLHVMHVDGGSGGTGGDEQRCIHQIHFYRNITSRRTVVVAHLDLETHIFFNVGDIFIQIEAITTGAN